MSMLAERLGVRPPSLYKHVGGLDALHGAGLRAFSRDLADALRRGAAGGSRLRGHRRRRGDSGTTPASTRAATATCLRPRPDDEEHARASGEVLSVLLEVLAGYGITGGDDAVDAARLVRSTLHGFGGPGDRRRLRDDAPGRPQLRRPGPRTRPLAGRLGRFQAPGRPWPYRGSVRFLSSFIHGHTPGRHARTRHGGFMKLRKTFVALLALVTASSPEEPRSRGPSGAAVRAPTRLPRQAPVHERQPDAVLRAPVPGPSSQALPQRGREVVAKFRTKCTTRSG